MWFRDLILFLRRELLNCLDIVQIAHFLISCQCNVLPPCVFKYTLGKSSLLYGKQSVHKFRGKGTVKSVVGRCPWTHSGP